VDLGALTAFIRHPAQWFFRERLGVPLDSADDDPPDEEPRQLDNLGMHALRERLFEQARRTGATELPLEPDSLERARGHLPPAPLGQREYADAAGTVNAVLPVYWARLAATTSLSLDFLLDDGTRVMGRVAGVGDGALCRLRPGPLRAKQLLPWWLAYLAVTASGRDLAFEVVGTHQGALDYRRAALTPDEARAHLHEAIAWFRAGQARPLLFDPYLAEHYLQQCARTDRHTGEPTSPADALRSTNGWLTNTWHPAHAVHDPWLQPLFATDGYPLGATPAASTLACMADAILAPLRDSLQAQEASV
jgi:exonuclease V gamma subunit